MGSQTKKVLLTPLMRPARPFRVSNHDRSSRRGVTASSLQELLTKVPHQPTWAPGTSQCKTEGLCPGLGGSGGAF